VARENVSADQIVVGEILGALGLHLAMNGPGGGEFIYSEPGYTALVDSVAPGGGVVIGVALDQNLQNDLTDVAAALNTKGIEIGRAFPPLDHWVRISIGLRQENALARDAIAGLLH
jgi:histidinol-phosphate/aromatic aminotransferase/cobyric acid decarboxylase-like protein